MRSSSSESYGSGGAAGDIRSLASTNAAHQRQISADSETASLLAGRLAFCRSLNEHYGSAQSSSMRKMSSVTLDTKQIRIYLKRQNSRGSLNSSASVGLVDAVAAAAAAGAVSRPMSADDTSLPSTSAAVPTPTTTQKQQIAVAKATPPRPVVAAACGKSVVVGFDAASGSASPASRVAPYEPRSPISEPPLVGRSSSIPSSIGLNLKLRPSFSDKVCQVTSYLYMGGIEAAHNANLLCRLNIEYIIDISNVEPQNVPRNKRSDCPCLCPLETAHSRCRMTITIDENSQIDLLPYFRDVNRFIEPTRQGVGGKSALIYSYHGRNRCAVLVLQHLIKTQNSTLQRAEKRLKDLWPSVRITDNFYRALARWEALCSGGPINDEYYEQLPPALAPLPSSDSSSPSDSPRPSQSRRAAWM